MTGHGFAVTGDPADLPPGVKIIELDMNPHVNACAEGIQMAMREDLQGDMEPWAEMAEWERAKFRALAWGGLQALIETGWRPPEAESLIKQALAEEEAEGRKGDPRGTPVPDGHPRHWLTRFDPVNGEPYGEICTCPIGDDHTGENNGE